MDRDAPPELEPDDPPGRLTRKAVRYSAEIQRLRAAGYTFRAIRVALAKAGVLVSEATVRREALRRPAGQPVGTSRPRAPPPASPATPALAAPPAARPAPVTGELRSGREIAEQFVARHIGNPLIRRQESK